MAIPEDSNPLAEIQASLAQLSKIPPSTLASGGVAAAAKGAAGVTPEEAPSGALAEITASLTQISKSTVPPLIGARPSVTGLGAEPGPTEGPVVAAPAGAPKAPSPLDEIHASLAQLQGGAVAPEKRTAVATAPAEDVLAPWSDRLSKRFHEAWNAPGEGVAGHTWGTINTPIISETDLEAWLGNPSEQVGTLFGGITKGVYGLLGGLTSPLSLGFILGTAGVGGLVEGGAAATLRVAGMEAGEIAAVVKGSEVLAKGIKAGMTSKEALGAMELAGINSSTVSKGLDILSKAGLTSHDLIRGGLIRTVGSSALRNVGMGVTKAENVGRGLQLLIDGGFAAQNVYGAAVAFPSALDALKEGDTETAARLITEATGIAGFGLLGTKAFLKEAGGMMEDFQVNAGLKVKPSDENMMLQREFGIADRQLTEAGRTHEIWAGDIRKLYKAALAEDGGALVRNFVDAGGDEATMSRNYDLVKKSAGRQQDSTASLLTIQPEITEAPKARMRKTQPTVIPKSAETVPLYESEKYPGGDVSLVFDNYHNASEVLSDQNPYVRLSADPVKSAKSTTNEGRTLLVQISSNLINESVASIAEKLRAEADLDVRPGVRPLAKAGEAVVEAAAKPELTPDEMAVQYYDKLYANTRPGYAKLHDFWEIPDWIARASHFLPDADLYVVRSAEAAKKFLNNAKYDRVLFSALDVNRDIIKSILYSEENKSGYSGRVDMGGYIDPAFFKDHPNVNWHDSLDTMATAMGAEFKPGVSYRHFQGSDTIPRLTLSEGCLHKCAFCVIANTALKLSPEEVVNQQVGEIAKLGAKLVYLNDKTFGQAKNYQDLAGIYERIKKENPAFHGFAVQTTAAQLNKIPEEWLAKSGIKYVELGIESFNDPLLKEMHKPANEMLINKGVDKLRRNGIALIPNIIIGYPGETAATYQHTMDFLTHNRDIISHANVYNLALYKDVELGKKMTTASDGDFNENILEKSWHTDPHVVKKFAGDLYGMLQQHLDQIPDVLQPLRPLSELTPTEIKQLSVGRRAEVFLNVLQQAPEVQELVAAAKAGSKGRDWYDRSIKAFDAMRELAPGYFKPEDADVFAGVLAATSPVQPVVMNLREALTFWKEWKDNGSPTTAEEILRLQKKKKITPFVNQGAKLPNALKAINRETMLPETKDMYFKVGNFAQNLQDIFKDPSGTFDSWMGVFFGFDERKVPTASFYHAMAVQTRLAARELGWSPKQAQAAIWSFTKTLAETSGWKGDVERAKYRPQEVIDFMVPEDYSTYSKDFADLMHEDPEVRAKLHMMGVNINELDKRIQAIPRPAPVAGANEAATSEILRRSAQRIGEAQQKLEGFGGYSEYFPGERFDFEREVTEAKPKTETPEFKNWFGDSKLVDSEGKPVVMYHGTTTNFTEFSKRKGSPEGDWGAGLYFTNEPQDVNVNYASAGAADLLAKLQDRASQIMDRTEEQPVGYGTPEYEARHQRAMQQARKELGVQHGGAVLPTYLTLKNPLEIGGAAEPRWDYKDIRKFLSKLRQAGSKAQDFRFDQLDLDIIADMDGRKVGEILDNLWTHGEVLWNTSDAKGRLNGKDLVRKAIEGMGYDGIIDRTVYEKFPSMEGMNPETFHAIAFKPEQVKSATGNLGTFDPANPDIRAEIKVPGFFSPLQRATTTLPDRIGSLSVGKWLTNRGVTKMELEESGLPEWLSGAKRTVSKEEIKQFLAENAATVSDKLLGATAQSLTPTEQMWLAQFQKMERTNRGFFSVKFTPEETKRYDAIKAKVETKPTQYETHQAPFQAGAVPNSYRELIVRSVPAGMKEEFKGTHYGAEGNVLGWLRFDERVTPDGKRTMFLHEVQEGDAIKNLKQYTPAQRKENVRKSEADIQEAKVKLDSLLNEITPSITDPLIALERIYEQYKRDREERISGLAGSKVTQDTLEAQLADYKILEKAKDELRAAEGVLRASQQELSSAPRVPYSENWLHVLLKRALHYAAENGYDQVAWTSGEHQNTRWNLSKVVHSLKWSLNPDIKERIVTLAGPRAAGDLFVSPEGVVRYASAPGLGGLAGHPLDEVLGKDLARKIMSSNEGNLAGTQLEVGGKGMLGFYGSQKTGELGMVGEFYRGYGKKWGARVGKTEIPRHQGYEYVTGPRKQSPIVGEPVHAVGVTPAMKSEILGPGQNISKEVSSGGKWMVDPKGNAVNLGNESHAAWSTRNFPGKRLDDLLDQGYIRASQTPSMLMLDVSMDHPNWKKALLSLEEQTPGNREIHVDINKGQRLVQQVSFDSTEQFRDYFSGELADKLKPAKPLEVGNYMRDPKGVLHKLEPSETHRQWIERNFSDPDAGVEQRRADFDRALEEGYVRVRNEKDGLLIEASKLNPNWVRDVNYVERLSPGDKPVYLDTFQKGSLKQHHFEDPQEFRDWLTMQREITPEGQGVAEARSSGRAAEAHPLAQFEGTQPPSVVAPFVQDKLNRLGGQLARIDDPDTGKQVVGLFKNERGEHALVLAGKGFESMNRVLRGALSGINGGSARAEAVEGLVDFMARHSNQYIRDLAAVLQPVKGHPLTFLMLTGPDPFATLLHEHVHGALSDAEVSAVHQALQNLPGYDDALTEISGLTSENGQMYSSEAQIIGELLPRLLAGQLLGKGIPAEALINLTWEALNAVSDQSAYERILGNIHPDVRGQFDAYIHPERAANEGRPVSEQPTGAAEGRGPTQAGAVTGAPEQGRGRVQAGTEESAPRQDELDQRVSEGLIASVKRELDEGEPGDQRWEPLGRTEEPGSRWEKVPQKPVWNEKTRQWESAIPKSRMTQALENVKITEGFTVNPATGFVPKSKGFAVEAIPERRQTFKRDITIKDIEAFAEKNKVLLYAHPELFIGGYGKELNISTVLKTAEAAKEFGKRLDQETAWDFAKGELLTIGGTGQKVSFEAFPLDERLALTRRNSINVKGPVVQIQRELGEAPRDTSETRLHELAAQQHIKKNYSEKEIDALLRSYDPKRLTDQHRALAGDVKKHFTGNFERASEGGALEEGLEHYVTHMWQKDANNPAANRLLAEARSGSFAVNTSMARHRTFSHAIEGQLLGRRLAVTDPIALAAHNGNTFDRVLAARKVLERLQDKGLRASDGRPMVALSGSGTIVQGKDGENPAVLVHPDKVRSIRIANKVVEGLRKTGDLDRLLKEGRVVKYGEVEPIATAVDTGGESSAQSSKGTQHYAWATHDYRSVSHPSFEGWQMASQDTNGNPVLVRGELKAHPEAYQYIKRQLETQSPLAETLKPLFTAGREAKGILLSFDIFHLVQESLRALMTGVSPFGAEKWDLRTNPTLGLLVENGLTMKNYGAIDSFQEGQMVGHSHLLSKVPYIGPASGWFQDFLFQKYVPGLKARAAEHLYNRYKKAYPEYSDSKVAQLAAEDTNMRFGGLNLKREGRALATQDVFRLVALAPDWLESEMRSMSRAMGGDGQVMRRDLAKVAVTMWLAARVLNQLNTGNAHYEAPFGVAYKDDEGREKVISLRTLPTDMLHAVTDPLKFMRYRASPLERTISTVYTGRDEQGRRLPARDLVWDILGDSVVPLPLQNVTKKMSGFSPQENWKELGIRGAGAQVTAYKTDAMQKASQLSADRSDSGPVDPDKLRAHAVKIELEDRLRSGSIQPQELWQMVDQDLISPREAKGMMTNINKTRGMEPDMAKLYTRAARLPTADFLLVWESATNAEKAALTPLMLKKKSSYFKKVFTEFSGEERRTDATYLKLKKLFPEQPPF